jgi:DNA processing protein
MPEIPLEILSEVLSETGGASPAERDLLVALFATADLDRGALSVLARDPARWARRLHPRLHLDAASPRRAASLGADLSAELALPRAQVGKALAAAAEAPRLAATEEERTARHGGRLVTWLDPDYPESLRHLALPPPVLAMRSAAPELPRGPAVAIVGSRHAGEYGRETAERFAREIAAAGVVVVSGFAHGIDAAAHRGALAAPGGRTVAVLGCGLDVDYPRGHAGLADEIAASGALLSELPCGAPPLGWHFPARNRIIAALSAGTLVVEAAVRSGSLVTARHALDLGREVWAIPGRLGDPRAAGPNGLIRDGAALVEEPRDVLETLGLRSLESLGIRRTAEAPATVTAVAKERPPAHLSTLLDEIGGKGEEAAPEDLAAAAGVPVDRVLAALLELELGGWIVRRPGPRFARA